MDSFKKLILFLQLFQRGLTDLETSISSYKENLIPYYVVMGKGDSLTYLAREKNFEKAYKDMIGFFSF